MTGHPHQWYGGRTYAQHGDDLILLNIFKSLGIERPSYLDIGAHHPFDLSNTALLYERGSRGINVEPNPALIPAFLRYRPQDVNVNSAVGSTEGMATLYRASKLSGRNSTRRDVADSMAITDVIDVPMTTVGKIVAEYAGGAFPDLLTIDTEGSDLDILKSVDFTWGPKVVCAEVATGSAEVSGDVSAFMGSVGYFTVFRAGSNLIFARDDLRQRFA